jgi:hypothetical protein
MLQLILDNLGPIVGLVFSLVTMALAWGIRKLGLKKELEDAIDQFVHRTLDKAHDRLTIALSPTSDGGVAITKAEMSQIRQAVWDSLKGELTGPLAKMLLAWGEERVKGLIGIKLAEKGVIATATPVA